MNILKRDRQRDSPPRWWVILGMPDERPISDRQAVKIKTDRRKTFPLFGKIVDVTWKGTDHYTGLVDVLSNDETVRNLAKKIGNLEIRSYTREFQGWTLQVDRRFELTNQDLATIQKIANYLFSSPRIY
jgi:hypothetical protein